MEFKNLIFVLNYLLVVKDVVINLKREEVLENILYIIKSIVALKIFSIFNLTTVNIDTQIP